MSTFQTHSSSYANTLPEHSRDEFYENSQRYQQQMAPDFHAHMMSSSREMLNRVSDMTSAEGRVRGVKVFFFIFLFIACIMYSQKRHKSWLESNKKSNRRYSLLESKSSSLENHSRGSFSDKKMVR